MPGEGHFRGDIVVLGGIAEDVLIRVPRLAAAGEPAKGDVCVQTPGGKGLNQAVVAARLRAHVRLVGRATFVPRFAVEAVDTTGSGDAMAAIAVRLSEGADLPDAVRFGSAAAALASTVLGALPSLPTRTDVERLVRQGQR